MTEEELDMIIFQSHGKEEKALLQLRAERDELKAQLYKSCDDERHDPEGCACPLGYRLTEVEAERDALRKDAERYRWLRGQLDADDVTELRLRADPCDMVDAQVDDAIDAALRGEE